MQLRPVTPAPAANVPAGQGVTHDCVSTDRYVLLVHSLHCPAWVHALQSVIAVHVVQVRPVTPAPVGNVKAGQVVTHDSLSTDLYSLLLQAQCTSAVAVPATSGAPAAHVGGGIVWATHAFVSVVAEKKPVAHPTQAEFAEVVPG